MRLLPMIASIVLCVAPAFGQSLPQGTWDLVELNGIPFAERASIDLSVSGKVSGQAPCNRFAGTTTGAWPDITLGPMVATRMACDALEAEAKFLAALAQVTKAEIVPAEVGDALVLTGPEGTPVMSFLATPAENP